MKKYETNFISRIFLMKTHNSNFLVKNWKCWIQKTAVCVYGWNNFGLSVNCVKKYSSSSRGDGNFDKSKKLSKSQKTNVLSFSGETAACRCHNCPLFCWMTVDLFQVLSLVIKPLFYGHSMYLYYFFTVSWKKSLSRGTKPWDFNIFSPPVLMRSKLGQFR